MIYFSILTPFALFFILGRANYLLLLLEKDPRGSQLSSPPQTPPPARIPPHQDTNCFNSCQHSLSSPLQRVLYVYLLPQRQLGRREGGMTWYILLLEERTWNVFVSLLQWTSAQPVKMTLTVKTVNRSWRATPAATVSLPVRRVCFTHTHTHHMDLLGYSCPDQDRCEPAQHSAVWQMGIRRCHD